MSVGVGLRVGTSVSSVAVTSPSPGRPDPDPIERRTAVHLHSDGTATLGEHDVVDGTTSSFTDFVDRIGRSGGVRANDGALSRAEDLVATAMECLLADAAPLIGDNQYTAVATHPTDWPPSTVAVLRNALDYVGLRHVSLISDAEAAAAWFESQVSHQTGRLVAVYHIDPRGSTVTLVRSGVAAGKASRFAAGDAPSVPEQLTSALGAFGWLVSNLDAIVVTVDEMVDPSAAQLVAQAVKSSIGVRCALAPDPHQTMVRGAAVAAAAGSVDLLGSTQVLPAARLSGPKRSELDPETTTVIAKITATPAPDRAAAAVPPAATKPPADPDTPEPAAAKRRSSLFTAGAVAAAVVLLVGVAALVFALRDASAASATTQVVDTTSVTPAPTTTRATTPPSSSTTTSATPTTTEETVEEPAPAPVVPVAPEPARTPAATSTTERTTTTDRTTTATKTTTTTTSTTRTRRNPPTSTDEDSGSSSPSQSTTAPTTTDTDDDESDSESSTTETTGSG